MGLKLINGYYIDENNNEWDALLYTLEEATEASDGLSGCIYCTNCHSCNYCSSCKACKGCSYCSSCKDCNFCHYCKDCNSCYACRDCNSCNDCTDCGYCADCDDCNYCHSCTNCSYCDDCRSCGNFDRNPQRIVGWQMGRREDTPIVYWLEVGKEQCVVGCFRGNLNELEEKVKETHKDNSKHLNDYLQWIEKVRKYQKEMED